MVDRGVTPPLTLSLQQRRDQHPRLACLEHRSLCPLLELLSPDLRAEPGQRAHRPAMLDPYLALLALVLIQFPMVREAFLSSGNLLYSVLRACRIHFQVPIARASPLGILHLVLPLPPALPQTIHPALIQEGYSRHQETSPRLARVFSESQRLRVHHRCSAPQHHLLQHHRASSDLRGLQPHHPCSERRQAASGQARVLPLLPGPRLRQGFSELLQQQLQSLRLRQISLALPQQQLSRPLQVSSVVPRELPSHSVYSRLRRHPRRPRGACSVTLLRIVINPLPLEAHPQPRRTQVRLSEDTPQPLAETSAFSAAASDLRIQVSVLQTQFLVPRVQASDRRPGASGWPRPLEIPGRRLTTTLLEEGLERRIRLHPMHLRSDLLQGFPLPVTISLQIRRTMQSLPLGEEP